MAFGETAAGLVFKITARNEASAEIKKLRRDVESETKAIEQAGTSAFLAVGKSVGLSTSEIAQLGAILPVVGTAIAAAATTAVGLGAAVFALAKHASEAGSQIYDLSQRTGASVELLSAFRLVTEQSNSSVEEFGNGLSKFNRLIGEAAHGSQQATEKLKRFGIDPQEALKDQEAALGKVFARINALPPGIQRSIAAQEAFGKSGDRLVDTIQSVGGSLDEFMDKARQSGQVMSKQAARDADAFGDALARLRFQLSELFRHIGQEAIPALTRAMDDLNRVLSVNGNKWASWGKLVRASIASVRGIIEGLVLAIATRDPSSFFRHMVGSIERSAQADRRDDQVSKALSSGTGTGEGRGGGGRGGGGGAADKARQEALRQLQEETKAIEDAYRAQTDAIKREYDQQRISSQEHTAQLIAEEEKRFNALRDVLIRQRALEKEVSGKARVDRELLEAQRESNRNKQKLTDEQLKREADALRNQREQLLSIIDTYNKAAAAKYNAAADARLITEEEAARAIGEIEDKALQRLIDVRLKEQFLAEHDLEERQKIELEINKLEAERTAHAEETVRRVNAARQVDIQRARAYRDELRRQSQDGREAEIDNERAVIEAMERTGAHRREIINARRKLERKDEELRHSRALDSILAQRAENDKEATTAAEHLEATEIYNRAAEEENERHRRAMGEKVFDVKTGEDTRRGGTIDHRADAELANRPGLFSGVSVDIRDASGEITDSATTAQAAIAGLHSAMGDLGQMAAGAFGQMAQGFGDLAQQWILYGALGEHAVRKMVASVVASFAAQAITKGLMHAADALAEYAMGIAALANPFTAWLAPGHFAAATAHGVAAAAYGALGVGAAIGGRAIAGSTFSKESGGARGAGVSDGYVDPTRDTFERRQSAAAVMPGILDRLAASIDRLETKSPGDVVVIGAQQRPDAIGSAVLTHQQQDAGFTRQLVGNAGLG